MSFGWFWRFCQFGLSVTNSGFAGGLPVIVEDGLEHGAQAI
jgi:hypothetical protein